MEDRVLNNEEKMKLLEKIVLDGKLSEIEKTLSSIKNNSNDIVKETNVTSNTPDEASIYDARALPFVKDDLASHTNNANPSYEVPPVIPEEEKVGPVLKKVPNPWGESGAKTVAPGEINY